MSSNPSSIKSGMLSTLNAQWRVIYALIMREIITRFGRNNLGFLWFAAEAIILTIVIIGIRRLESQPTIHSVAVVPFFVIGYSNLLVWRFCTSRGLGAIGANLSLLYYRQILIQDIFLARMLLEIAGVTLSFFVLWFVCALMDLMTWPRDPFLLVIGWFFTCWFSASFGTVLGCISEFSEFVRRIWSPLSFISLFFSGVYFEVDWLPKNLQNLVLMFPPLHAVEMTRAGYWGEGSRWHYSVMFITVSCMAMTLLAGFLMKNRALREPHL